jgi:hypothetical protein
MTGLCDRNWRSDAPWMKLVALNRDLLEQTERVRLCRSPRCEMLRRPSAAYVSLTFPSCMNSTPASSRALLNAVQSADERDSSPFRSACSMRVLRTDDLIESTLTFQRRSSRALRSCSASKWSAMLVCQSITDVLRTPRRAIPLKGRKYRAASFGEAWSPSVCSSFWHSVSHPRTAVPTPAPPLSVACAECDGSGCDRRLRPTCTPAAPDQSLYHRCCPWSGLARLLGSSSRPST